MSQSDPPQSQQEEPIPRPLEWLREHSIPIIGLLGAVVVALVTVRYSSVQIDWQATNSFTSSLQNVVQVSAFMADGWWAYYRFVKGRVFQESLVATISGRFVCLDGVLHLIATIQIRNVGSSKIDFDHAASALTLFEYTPTGKTEIHSVADKCLTSFEVLNPKNKYIEPNEIIEMQEFISIPGGLRLAYRLEVEVLSTSGFAWNASAIVDKTSIRDNEQDSMGLLGAS